MRAKLRIESIRQTFNFVTNVGCFGGINDGVPPPKKMEVSLRSAVSPAS
jgi:hypothetical protein